MVGRLGGSLLLSQEPGALLRYHVELSIDPVTLLVDELGGVSQISVHESESIWNTSVTHQNHDLMDGLWVLGKVVPEHGRIIGTGQVCCGISFLGVDEVWELGWVSKEENRCVVCNQVPVTLVGLELHGEASWITSTRSGRGDRSSGSLTTVMGRSLQCVGSHMGMK